MEIKRSKVLQFIYLGFACYTKYPLYTGYFERLWRQLNNSLFTVRNYIIKLWKMVSLKQPVISCYCIAWCANERQMLFFLNDSITVFCPILPRFCVTFVEYSICALFFDSDKSVSNLPGQQESSTPVLPDAVSASPSLPVDGSSTVPERLCRCESPPRRELWQTRKGLSNFTSGVIASGDTFYLSFANKHLFIFLF